MMVVNIPIESLEERYSAQWNRWIPNAFGQLGVTHITIYPEPLVDRIEEGVFLDVVGTNYFKAMQLAMLMNMIKNKVIKSGDVLFFHDIWFPGLEAIQYVKQAKGLDIKITGVLHAGTYDEWDFLAQKGMGYWGQHIEKGWLEFIDKVFVATQFHKDMILKARGEKYARKIEVTGLPYYSEDVVKLPKEDIIVFPHRLDIEKQPELFLHLEKHVGKNDWCWVMTKNVCKTKKEYYELLGKSKIALSFAIQETWGIAMLESVLSGALPLVPDRLSYRELYPKVFTYSGFFNCLEKVIYFMELFTKKNDLLEHMEEDRMKLEQKFIANGEVAIEKMVACMRRLF